jgi:hypothetical protein
MVGEQLMKRMSQVTVLLVVLALVASLWTPVSGLIEGTNVTSVVKSKSIKRPIVQRSGGFVLNTTGPLAIALPNDRHVAVHLSCALLKQTVDPQEGVARFDSIPNSNCTILLDGTDKPYGPVFPGDWLSCGKKDGETVCKGGLAVRHSGKVSIKADYPAELELDGKRMGPLPFSNLPMSVGKHIILLTDDSGGRAKWSVNVAAEERVSLHFQE